MNPEDIASMKKEDLIKFVKYLTQENQERDHKIDNQNAEFAKYQEEVEVQLASMREAKEQIEEETK